MPKRDGNDPKRRIARPGAITPDVADRILRCAVYTGSPHHKRIPADYGFHPPVAPRPDKSLCDDRRVVARREARALFSEGVKRAMISRDMTEGLPKYVWAVDSAGRAYEAKIGGSGRAYHGYELNETDPMRRTVIREWNAR